MLGLNFLKNCWVLDSNSRVIAQTVKQHLVAIHGYLAYTCGFCTLMLMNSHKCRLMIPEGGAFILMQIQLSYQCDSQTDGLQTDYFSALYSRKLYRVLDRFKCYGVQHKSVYKKTV